MLDGVPDREHRAARDRGDRDRRVRERVEHRAHVAVLRVEVEAGGGVLGVAVAEEVERDDAEAALEERPLVLPDLAVHDRVARRAQKQIRAVAARVAEQPSARSFELHADERTGSVAVDVGVDVGVAAPREAAHLGADRRHATIRGEHEHELAALVRDVDLARSGRAGVVGGRRLVVRRDRRDDRARPSSRARWRRGRSARSTIASRRARCRRRSSRRRGRRGRSSSRAPRRR